MARRSDLCSSFLHRLATLWAGSSAGGVVALATSKHGPDDTCVLVGDGNRGSVEATPLVKLVDPGVEGVCFLGRCSHDSPGPVNKQTSQVLAPALGDPKQCGSFPTGMLPWHQTDPG